MNDRQLNALISRVLQRNILTVVSLIPSSSKKCTVLLLLVLGASTLFFALAIIKKSRLSQVSRSSFKDKAEELTQSRKLKDYSTSRRRSTELQLEDYHPIDPVPSSKATIKSGPIEHGIPLNPYVPLPPPPEGQPKHPGGS